MANQNLLISLGYNLYTKMRLGRVRLVLKWKLVDYGGGCIIHYSNLG